MKDFTKETQEKRSFISIYEQYGLFSSKKLCRSKYSIAKIITDALCNRLEKNLLPQKK